MKILYISHPCTSHGDIAENYTKARQFADKYKQQGYHVINPLEVVNPDSETHEAMSVCLDLLKLCDAIVMCGKWQESTGCKEEYWWAKRHGMEILKD